MRVLVTGSSGFVGSYLVKEFVANGYDVICSDINSENNTIEMNIMDYNSVHDVVKKYEPDLIVNSAGQADVGVSWKKPQHTFELNTIGFINIMEAVKHCEADTRIIGIGSSDEYGALKEKGINVTENIALNPVTPYGISKASMEHIAELYVKTYKMDICIARLFNLGGAGQSKGFIISDFSSGIAEIENGKKSFLSVGNLESSRDFTHVKDACRAIRLIGEKGYSGDVYNICSGITHKASEILEILLKLSNTKITIKQDESKLRPSDTPVICGNHDKITEHTGWIPKYEFKDIISDALGYWRSKYITG